MNGKALCKKQCMIVLLESNRTDITLLVSSYNCVLLLMAGERGEEKRLITRSGIHNTASEVGRIVIRKTKTACILSDSYGKNIIKPYSHIS